MKKIIDNVAYDANQCEMVALRKRYNDGRYEYLLRAPNGKLLIAESVDGTCLGCDPSFGCLVMDASGRIGSVNSVGSDYCTIRGVDGRIPLNNAFPCHGVYTSLRLFQDGEQCDGFYIDKGSVKERLIELGLIKDMSEK